MTARSERVILKPLLQFLLQDRNRGGLLRGNIVFLVRVGCQVVEFGFGCIDIMVPACFEGMERTPTKRAERIKRLAIRLTFSFGSGNEEATRSDLLLDLVVKPRRSQKSGGHSGRLHGSRHTPRAKAAPSGWFHDQRNMHRRVIGKKPMLLLAVFAQRLAVVAEEDDQAAIIELIALQ